MALLLLVCTSVRALAPLAGPVRALSLDVTGTLITHGEPVMKTYADAAVWARLPNAPSEAELKVAFKAAYKEACLSSPCFGGQEGISGREWWQRVIRAVLRGCGRNYTDAEFDRYFRRVYQHFGSARGYRVLADADALLSWVRAERPDLVLGVTSNTPTRHMDSVLPTLGLHDHFRWFACSQDVRAEKPDGAIFSHALEQARFWLPDLAPHELLHVGDSLAADYCGARAFGCQAVYLDRSAEPSVAAYQDWLAGPEYPGKSDADIAAATATDLAQLVARLKEQQAR